MERKKIEKRKLEIIKSENFRSAYSNFASIALGVYDFVFSFGRVSPNSNQATLEVEIIMSPEHAKAFYEMFKSNIEEYEKSFGEIKTITSVDKKDA